MNILIIQTFSNSAVLFFAFPSESSSLFTKIVSWLTLVVSKWFWRVFSTVSLSFICCIFSLWAMAKFICCSTVDKRSSSSLFCSSLCSSLSSRLVSSEISSCWAEESSLKQSFEEFATRSLLLASSSSSSFFFKVKKQKIYRCLLAIHSKRSLKYLEFEDFAF